MPTQTWTDDFHGTDYFASYVYSYNNADDTSASDPIVDSEVRSTPGKVLQWIDPRAAFIGNTLISATVWAEFVFPTGHDFPEVSVGLVQGIYGEALGVFANAAYCWDDSGPPGYSTSGLDWSGGSGLFDDTNGRLELDLLPDGTLTRVATVVGAAPTTESDVVPYIDDFLSEYVTLYPYVAVEGNNAGEYTAVTSWGYTIVTTLPVQSASTVFPGVGSAGALRHSARGMGY